MAEVGDSSITETSEINKSTVPAHLLSSLSSSQKMSPLSRLSAILATRRRRALDVVEPSLEDGANEADAQIPGADEDNSNELVDEGVNKDITTMTTEEVAVVRGAEDDLAGRTTISRNETAMRLLTSSPTGRCWRRLISIVWRS